MSIALADEIVSAEVGSSVSFGAEDARVPPFKVYNASELQMSPVQQGFFRVFETRFRGGKFIDLEEQWSYAFALVSKLRHEYNGDRVKMRAVYERFDVDYPDSPVAGLSWRDDVDDLLEKGDWQGAYDLLMPDIPMGIYLALESVVADSRLRVSTVECWTTQKHRTTSALRTRKAEVDVVLQDLLNATHENLGRSVVTDLWHRLIGDLPRGAARPNVAEEFGGFITQEQIEVKSLVVV